MDGPLPSTHILAVKLLPEQPRHAAVGALAGEDLVERRESEVKRQGSTLRAEPLLRDDTPRDAAVRFERASSAGRLRPLDVHLARQPSKHIRRPYGRAPMSSEGSDEALAAQQQHPLAELPTGETTAESSPADVRPASPAVEGDNPPASTASGLLGPEQHSSETGVDQVRVREN
jgi:hypothetical protein